MAGPPKTSATVSRWCVYEPSDATFRVHCFESTRDACDAHQSRPDIRDGDVLVIESEKVVGLAGGGWPNEWVLSRDVPVNGKAPLSSELLAAAVEAAHVVFLGRRLGCRILEGRDRGAGFLGQAGHGFLATGEGVRERVGHKHAARHAKRRLHGTGKKATAWPRAPGEP